MLDSPSSLTTADSPADFPAVADESVIRFGPFRVSVSQQLLFRDEQPVALGSRAFDVLAVLLEKRGEIVDKHHLIARVWPNLVVEECNLRTQILALRKALCLGEASPCCIVTVPRRGYRFVVPVNAPSNAASNTPEVNHRPRSALKTLPAPLIELIGRGSELRALLQRLRRQRLVTLTGPAGVGKSALALAAAHANSAAYPGGCYLIDLADGRPANLIERIARALQMDALHGESATHLGQRLGSRPVLLLIDNLDRQDTSFSEALQDLRQWAEHLHLLVTCREPLHVPGESVLRLLPLPSARPGAVRTVAEAMSWPAIQLFVERAQAAGEFAVTPRNLADVVALCHGLDGLPFALQLAAAHVETFGVRTLLEELREDGGFLKLEYPGASRRHPSLAALYEDQLSSLSHAELALAQRLGAIDGPFTLRSVRAISAGGAFDGVPVAHLLARLVSRSLVLGELQRDRTRYRMLSTLRLSLSQAVPDWQNTVHWQPLVLPVAGLEKVDERSQLAGHLRATGVIQMEGFSGRRILFQQRDQ